MVASRRRPHLIVCGDDALAYRLVEELIARDEQVTVLLRSRRRAYGPGMGKLLPRGSVIESERVDADALRGARVENAKAVAFMQQNDVENVHAALRVRAANPRIPIVVRLFNLSIADRVRELVENCTVISDAEMAAPSFVAIALGEIPDAHVELGGSQTLYLTRVGAVPAEKTVCGIRDTADGKKLVPAPHPEAELVLAIADEPPSQHRSALRHRMRRAATRAWDLLRETVDRKLRIATLILLGAVVVGTFLVNGSHRPPIGWFESAYIVILATAGAINPDLTATGVEQLTHIMIAFAGVALVPVMTATIVETVIGRRLAAATGQLRKPISDHVVVIGLGNIGVQVITQLANLGVPVVAIEENEDAPGVESARRLGVPVVHGDASRAETLQAAQVRTCRSLVAVTSSDVANLEAAWNARDIKPSLRTVLRVGDGDLAKRIDERSDMTGTLSVSTVAAPAFAAAMTAQDIKGTITVDRAVLVVSEVAIGAGSELDGAPVAALRVGMVRTGVWVLAVGTSAGPAFSPGPDRVLRAGDRILVVAGRADLRRTLRRAAAPVLDAV